MDKRSTDKRTDKRRKRVPEFRDEGQERAFWETGVRDSTEYLDWSQATRAVFPNLMPTSKPAASTTLASSPGTSRTKRGTR